MKNLLAVLILASAAAAAPPFKCADGGSPRLSGNFFSPIDCSSATIDAAALPVPPAKAQKIDLKALEGVYEGNVAQGAGVYELRLELKTGWLGRAEAVLRLADSQTHELSSHVLRLVPAGSEPRYAVVLTNDALPGKELKGQAAMGTVEVSTSPAALPQPPGMRQLDLQFANGASYRVRILPNGENAVRAKIWWTAPGAPARSFETKLKRLPPEKR